MKTSIWIGFVNSPVFVIIIFAFVGMIGAFMGKWAWSDTEITLRQYIFSDGKAIARAIIMLAGSIMGSMAVGIPINLDFTAAAGLGIAIGVAIPDKVADQEKAIQEKNARKKEEAAAPRKELTKPPAPPEKTPIRPSVSQDKTNF